MRKNTRFAHALWIALAASLCAHVMEAQNVSGNQPHGTVGGTCTLAQQQNGGVQAGQPTEEAQLETAMGSLISGVSTKGFSAKGTETRDLTNGALANFVTNTILTTPNPGSTASTKGTALEWVEQAFSALDTNNNVLFTVQGSTNPSSNDQNSSEFAMLGTSVMLAGNKFTISQLTQDNTLNTGAGTLAFNNMLLVLSAMVAHTSGSMPTDPVTYTNMYLMNTTGRILMDEALIAQSNEYTEFNSSSSYPSDNDAHDDLPIAEAQLHNYLENIQGNGIHEFDSPTYSGTQMESLVEGYRYVSSSTDKANFKTALDYLWMDIAANFFPGNIRIGGPFARDYDFRAGQGALQSWIEVLGCWTTGQVASGDPGTGVITAAGLTLEEAELQDILTGSAGYQLENSTYALATTVADSTGSPATYIQRNVFQSWGAPTNGSDPSPHPVRSDTIFDNVDIGCSSGNYGPQDKMFAAGLMGQASSGLNNRGLSLVSNVLDSSGNPYGTVDNNDADGEAKPQHLQENMACAPAVGAALLTMSVNGTARDATDNGLSTNILLPFDASYSTGSGTNPTYPSVQINGTSLSNILKNNLSTCTGSSSIAPYIIYCPLSMVSGTSGSYVTLIGTSAPGVTGGVIGVRFFENGWTDTNMNRDASTEQIPSMTSYRLELDFSGSLPNPTGASNSTARIAVIHSNVPKADEPGGYTVPAQFWVTALVVTGDTDTKADRVNAILKNATYSDVASGAPNYTNTFTVTFPSGDQAYTPSSPTSYLTQLQVVRSSTTLTDSGSETYAINGGTPSSTAPASGCTYPALYGFVGGSSTATCYADSFWAESAHLIH